MDEITKAAFDFLCRRNVLDDQINQSTYFTLIYEFMKTHGEEGIQALAGFYCWALDNLNDDDDKLSRALMVTFAHDLNGRNDRLMLPRSTNYLKFWQQEFSKPKYNKHHG